jgi:serine O-acetyltransferase
MKDVKAWGKSSSIPKALGKTIALMKHPLCVHGDDGQDHDMEEPTGFISHQKLDSKPKPAPLWITVRADVARLREEDPGVRALVRGIVSQGFQALMVYRVFRWFHERGIPTQPIRFFIERFTEITTGISIPVQARIGRGLRLHHFGGIIVHSEAVIGEGCTLYHGVTLGDLGGWGGAPRIGNHVVIGAGAKILGQIEVDDHCRIGANAVVRTSVPAGCLAVGVPAVIKQPGTTGREVM